MRVQTGKEVLLSIADRASAVDVIAELVWNGLDAEAMIVDVDIAPSDLGAPEVITVHDRGHGMRYDEIPRLFATHGDSWKRDARFSPNIHRPMHGKHGRGRFLVYGIAESAEWRSLATDSVAEPAEVLIRGRRGTPYEFEREEVSPVTLDSSGTLVRLVARQTPKVNALADPSATLSLVARFAATLLATPDVKITYCGEVLDPVPYIVSSEPLELDVDEAVLYDKPVPSLRVIEWETNMHSKTLFLCDQDGKVVTEYKLKGLPPTPVYWSAYLQWQGFEDPVLMSHADLLAPERMHGGLLASVNDAVASYLNRRFDEQRGQIIAEWKQQGVYPYVGEAKSPTEQVERDIFDIVAVVASPAIGREVRQRKLALRLLQTATTSEPSKTKKNLEAVLDLTEDDNEALSELLERTTLTSVVRMAQTVADRSDFLLSLRNLLYSDETRRKFREVDQLHPLIVREPWIFGEEWNLSLSESGLTRLVRTVVGTRKGAVFAPEPVTLPSNKKGRVDMYFYRYKPESERARHLVVELKRPGKLGMAALSQLTDYASTITRHPEIVNSEHFWDFWLVGTELDNSLLDFLESSSKPGLANSTPRYRLWVRDWGSLLDNAERRLQSFKNALDLASTEDSSRRYIEARHAEFIPR